MRSATGYLVRSAELSVKKIMFICGSPRENGNTMALVNWAAEAAREAGAEVEIVLADKLKYGVNGCIACMGCQQSEDYVCVVKDEATPILARMPEQDVLVFATPVYFMGFSAQLKLILDRMCSLVKIRGEEVEFAPGLKEADFALIATAGGKMDEGLQLTVDTMEAAAAFFGRPLKKLLFPLAPMEAGKMEGNEEWKAKAVEFGKSLCGE